MTDKTQKTTQQDKTKTQRIAFDIPRPLYRLFKKTRLYKTCGTETEAFRALIRSRIEDESARQGQ